MQYKLHLKKVLLLLGLLFFNATAYGYDEERAKANLASDFAECAAFYSISLEGFKRTGEDTTMVNEAFQTALYFGIQFSNFKVTEARIKLSMDEQTELMGHDFSNFAILIEKYAKFCKELLENPEKRLQFWLDNRN